MKLLNHLLILIFILLHYLSAIHESKHPNFGSTYVINLDRRAKRINFMQYQLEYLNLSFTRISGVDGKILDRWMHTISYLQNRARYKPPSMVDFGLDHRSKFVLKSTHYDHTKLTTAQIGCQQSHLNVYFRIIDVARESGEDLPVLILEDDVLLEKNIMNEIYEIFKILPDNWEYLALGNLFDNGSCIPVVADRLCRQIIHMWGTHAYILRNSSVARKLVRWSNREWPVAADHIYLKHLKNGDLYLYQVYPKLLAIQDRKYMSSDIVTQSRIRQRRQYTNFSDLIMPYKSISTTGNVNMKPKRRARVDRNQRIKDLNIRNKTASSSTLMTSQNKKLSNCIRRVQNKLLVTVDKKYENRQWLKGVFADLPSHENLGDSFIWLGEALLLHYMQYKPLSIYSFSADPARRGMSNNSNLTLKAQEALAFKGVLFLHGGGNFGDLYPKHNIERLGYLKIFPDIRSVVFPQSIYYKNETLAHEDCHALSGFKSLTVLLRDEASQQLLDRVCTPYKLNTILVPDAAFMIGEVAPLCIPTYDVVYLQRKDKEKVKHYQNNMIALLRNNNITCWVGDWERYKDVFNHPSPTLMSDVPRYRLAAANHMLCRGKVILTDRLHAAILAILMNKPAVALDNSYNKIQNVLSSTVNMVPEHCSLAIMNVKLVSSVDSALMEVIAALRRPLTGTS